MPARETVEAFLEVMSHEQNYPILIHCHHGYGRSSVMTALYRIEFEGWDNDTRWFTPFSSFDRDASKGAFLLSYSRHLKG